MHEAVPLYALKGATLQSTACACADGTHPVPPIANSAVMTPALKLAVVRGPLRRSREALPPPPANSEVTTS
ncbi:hypothetical protein AB4084_10430 [Lysobacter sp. 2RAB21]